MNELVEKNIPLAPHTTLLVGGVAAYFHRLANETVLPQLAAIAKELQVPVWVLGGGSNVLIADGVINRLVIKNELLGIMHEDDGDDVLVTAAAGENWDAFVDAVVARGLSGLENLSGIPGTVGASPIQNINAYGAQVADTIESVRVFDVAAGAVRVLSQAACAFGYRDSIFKHDAGKDLIVLAVTFRLSKAASANLAYRSASQSIARFLEAEGIAEPTLQDLRNAILHVRGNIGMLPGMFRSAGSFFKNTVVDADVFARVEEIVRIQFPALEASMSPWHWPLENGQEKISTAFLLECSEYNKRTYGEKRYKDVVGISPKHSLSIVTEAGATATDVLEFVTLVIASVEKVFGLTIEAEVNFILE